MFTKATFTLPTPSGEPYTHAIQPNGDIIVLRSLQGVTHFLAVLIKQAGEYQATKEQLTMVAGLSQLLVNSNPAIEIAYKAGASPMAKHTPLKDCRQLHLFKPPNSGG